MENPACAESSEPSTARIAVCADCVGTHRQNLSPFVLSLSKYERTLQPFPSVFFESFFNPYPSINSGRTDWKGVLRQRLSPFVLSLSKYERTLQPFQSLPFDRLRANGLERCLRTGFLRQAQDGAGRTFGRGYASPEYPSMGETAGAGCR
ncbi:MAG: hypothetical protein LBD67_02235 [Candidatus Accumulibacter sp.]|nr:hypothetical protein [Accumulibacter sp.]